MRRNNKKLYESIMKDVSKKVKKHLNESIEPFTEEELNDIDWERKDELEDELYKMFRNNQIVNYFDKDEIYFYMFVYLQIFLDNNKSSEIYTNETILSYIDYFLENELDDYTNREDIAIFLNYIYNNLNLIDPIFTYLEDKIN